MKAFLTAVLLPTALVAQPMECVGDVGDDPRLAPLDVALTQLQPAFPDLRQSLSETVQQICLAAPPFGAQGYFEPDTGRIVLSTALGPGLLQAVFFHEVRHAHQFATGSCPARNLSMQAHADAVMAMEADASVASLVIADALRALGETGMWQALATWPMQADIATAYDTELNASGEVSTAAAAAFDAWFTRPDRIELYYIASCLDYLDQQDRDHRLPRYESLDPGFYADLCILPTGGRYPCADPDPE